MRCFLIFLVFLDSSARSLELEIQGKIVSSETKTKVQSCGKYEVHLIEERFPKEYEADLMFTPDLAYASIPGFAGAAFIISSVAVIVPGGYVIPRANEIDSLPEIKESKRTYLPTEIFCTDSKVGVRYWSGGNGAFPGDFVEFDFLSGKLSSPRTTTSKEIRAVIESARSSM